VPLEKDEEVFSASEFDGKVLSSVVFFGTRVFIFLCLPRPTSGMLSMSERLKFGHSTELLALEFLPMLTPVFR